LFSFLVLGLVCVSLVVGGVGDSDTTKEGGEEGGGVKRRKEKRNDGKIKTGE